MRPVQPSSPYAQDRRDEGLSGPLPILPDYWMHRARLHQQLPATPRQRLTLVTGPAGSGKTLLVAGWARSAAPGSRRWVSLRRDREVGPSVWSDLLRDVDWETLTRGSDPEAGALLVIDNVETLACRATGAGLLDLLAAVPAAVRIVLVGRHAAALPLIDVSLDEAVAEIGGADLDFTIDEVIELYRMLGRPHSADVARAAMEQTGGWALGLRLAGVPTLKAPGAPAGLPAGDLGLLTEFFEREALAGEPQEVRALLEQVAVAPRLTVDVAEAISGRPDAGGVLERLAAENRFVRPDGEGRFALHRLFATVLVHLLSGQGAGSVVAARRRAAAALLDAHEEEAAARQLVAARDYDDALAIRLRALRQRLEWQPGSSREPALPGGMPDHFLCADPWRMYATCVALLVGEDLDEAAVWLVRLEVAAALPGAPAGMAQRAHRLRALHALALVDPEGALEHVARAAQSTATDDLGPPDPTLACIDADIANMMPCVASRAHAWLGRAADAREALGGSVPESRVPLGLTCSGTLAALALVEGRLREALEIARQTVTQARMRGYDATIGVLDGRLVAARVLLERDDLHGAAQELDEAETLCSQSGLRRWAAVVRAERARLAMEERRFEDALGYLDEARRPEVCGAASWFVDRRLDEIEIRCRLLMGDPTGAARIFDAAPPEWRSCELTARLRLASGRPDLAMNVLNGCRREAAPTAVAIERAVLRARCHAVTGNRRAAEQALQEAVELARNERFTRVFRDEPALVTEILRGVVAGAPESHLGSLERPATAAAPSRERAGVVLEPLTKRERELLDFLPSHLSQYEIARKMYLSANTVKTHMKGLYRKLGATSRSEAVDAARSCGLL